MTTFIPPKRFDLGGTTIRVVHNPDLRKTTGAMGIAQFNECQIQLDTEDFPVDMQAITFYHELLHFIMHTLGKDELRDDENFIDSAANLLWQSIKTAK